MSCFICTKCGCIDNTALGGNYWAVISKSNYFKDDYANKNILCVECCPTEYSDGPGSKQPGVWHNRFEKKHWSKWGTMKELLDDPNVRNAKEYFDNITEEELGVDLDESLKDLKKNKN